MYQEIFKYNTITGVIEDVTPTKNISQYQESNEEGVVHFLGGYTDLKPQMGIYLNVSPKMVDGVWVEDVEVVELYKSMMSRPEPPILQTTDDLLGAILMSEATTVDGLKTDLMFIRYGVRPTV